MTAAYIFATLFAAWLAYWAGYSRRTIIEVIPEGFVHEDYVRDPDHYDREGNYLWWGC